MDERMLYSRLEAAQILSISLRTLDHVAARGEIRVRRIGRKVLIPRTELERFSRADHGGRTKRAVAEAHAD